MLTAKQALQKASDTSRWAVGMCDNFVANMFGYTASGYPTAQNHWNSIPSQDKHPGDMNAPAGALMFWGGGAGHVALSDGHGGIFSTDMPSPGIVSHVSASTISSMWHKPYLGWSLPVFQGQVYNVANDASFNVTPAVGLGNVPLPGVGNVSKDVLKSIADMFGIDVVDMLERAVLMFLGFVLLLVGLFRVSGTQGRIQELVVGDIKEGREKQEKARAEAKKKAEKAAADDKKVNEKAQKERVRKQEKAMRDAIRNQEKQGRNISRRKRTDGGSESETHNETGSEETNTTVEGS